MRVIGAVVMTDGPRAETTERPGGDVILPGTSLDEPTRWAERPIAAVDTDEGDVRELEGFGPR